MPDALATINYVDLLVSWNFKHIVNVRRIKGYNSVNLENGYRTIDIRSPKDLIYYEDSDDCNHEEWYEYDKNNNCIYYKDSNDNEEWREYDKNRNIIHYRNSNNFEYWNEYDENSNIIHYKNSNNIEFWNDYK